MADSPKAAVYGLNINANPHPAGIYPVLLKQIAKNIVQARGSDYAKITSPKQVPDRKDFYFGRILIWTDINLKGRWLDLGEEDDLPDGIKQAIKIPPNAKPNYRSFDYVLDEKSHQIWFETKNDLGYSLGPSTARRIFSILLSREVLGGNAPVVEVTVIPEKGAVDRILQLPRLQTLTIRVTRPNQDASSLAARNRVFQQLDDNHAQQLELTLTKAPGSVKLTLTGEFEELAKVGADTGLVRGEEITGNGEKNTLSTTQLPQRLYIDNTPGTSFFTRLLAKIV